MTATATASALACAPCPKPDAGARWHRICPLDDIWPDTGVCALVGHRQIAIFHLADGSLHAIGNHDPHSGANVLSRGIVGDLGGQPVVASPIHKHHYQLRTGACLEDPETAVPTYAVQLRDGSVWLRA